MQYNLLRLCPPQSGGPVQTAVWLSFWRGFWQEYKGALCSSSLALFTENLKEKGGCVDLIKTRKLPSDLNRRAADCGCCNKPPAEECSAMGIASWFLCVCCQTACAFRRPDGYLLSLFVASVCFVVPGLVRHV